MKRRVMGTANRWYGLLFLGGVCWMNADESAAQLWSTGPDAYGNFGYGSTYNFRDIRSTGAQLFLGDDQSVNVPLGFSFMYNYNYYDSVNVSSNGFVSFTESGSYCCQGMAFPSASGPANAIAAGWSDLYPPSGSVYFETRGWEGSREFVVGYYDVPHITDSDPNSFEIVLHENSGNIELQYENLYAGSFNNTSVGIQDAARTSGLTAGYFGMATSGSSPLLSNTGYRFSPSSYLGSLGFNGFGSGKLSSWARELKQGGIQWTSFYVPETISASSNRFAMIMTTGAYGSGYVSDTELGLYDVQGELIAANDDWYDETTYGYRLQARIGFGANAPQDLPAGEYYLATSAFKTDHGSYFNASASSTHEGYLGANLIAGIELGELFQGVTSAEPQWIDSWGGTAFYRFSISDNITAGGNDSLIINLDRSELVDTEVAIYDIYGNLIATDDDSGYSFKSEMSFGAYGRYGDLEAGTYLIAATGFDADFYDGFETYGGYGEAGNILLDIKLDNNWYGELMGDFNLDGYVDAADYTVYRDGLGGRFSPEHRQAWLDNYGASNWGFAVPEAGTASLLMLACVTQLARSRREETAA